MGRDAGHDQGTGVAGRSTSQPTLGPLFVTTFLRFLALAIVMVPAFSLRFQDLASESGMDAASMASAYGAVAALRGVTEFASTPILASLSDRSGRRPILCLACFGLVVECFVLWWSRSLLVLSSAHVSAGLLGSPGTLEVSCIADATVPGYSRSVAIGRLFTLIGASFALGPAIGGELATFGGSVPFAAAFFMSSASLLCASRLPEYRAGGSVQVQRADVQGSPGGRGSVIMDVVEMLKGAPPLRWYLCASALSSLAMSIFTSAQPHWALHVLGWEGRDLGRFVSAVGGSLMVSQSIMLPLLLKAMAGREAQLAQSGLLLSAAKLVMYGLAPSGFWVYLALTLGAPGQCSMAVLQSLASRCAPEEKQGLLSGVSSSVGTAAQIFGTLLGSRVFAAALRGALPLSTHSFLGGIAFTLAALSIARATQVDKAVKAVDHVA